jgi:ubiquitin-conjugating enzyme E2 W
MKCHFFILQSLLLGATEAAYYKQSGGKHTYNRITLSIDRIQQHQHQQVLLYHALPAATALVVIRGGAISSTNTNNKLRNVIRSLLDITEKKAPALAKLFQMFLKTTETLTGMSLLPAPASPRANKETTSKKQHGKAKKKPKKIDDMNDEEKQQETTTTTAATTKKQKTSTSTRSNAAAAASSSNKTRVKTKTRTAPPPNMHLDIKLKSTNPNYRIQRELKEFLQHPPLNLKVKVGSNIRVWIITLTMKSGSIYEGETFRLRVLFPPSYPTVPPSVYFLPPTPQHEHVYTNGDICLSLLGKGWLPSMTAQSIAVSIQSILSSAQTKSLPMDNARHSQNKPGQYQKDWVYHDDNC